MSVKDGGPAFPCALPSGTAEEIDKAHALGIGVPYQSFAGASLRDFFAAAALQAAIASDDGASVKVGKVLGIDPDVVIAQTAYGFADAMIAERERQP